MGLQRYAGNPVFSAHPPNWWEGAVTANPGAWYDEAAGEVRLLYRASAADVQHKVYLGLATSRDGYQFTRASNQPAVALQQLQPPQGSHQTLAHARAVTAGLGDPEVGALDGVFGTNKHGRHSLYSHS